jgi:hypothetical protein
MKRFATVLLISLWAVPVTFGSSGTWVGTISDRMCGISHAKGPYGGQGLTDTECLQLCIASKEPYVFVTDNAVYAMANQNFKDLRSSIGQKVQLDGDLDGTTITVSKISAVHKKNN